MPLTNEAVIPIGMKDRWNATSPYANNDLQFAKYFTNPELALYMDDSKFGAAVPSLKGLRIQSKSLGSFDFRNGQPGLFGLKGNPALDGTALAENAFGAVLLPDNASPRAVDLLPIFYTGVPNLRPYQLATGKAGNPLAAGKPFIHNFLPTLGDMLRLNMAVPATPRNDPNFSSLGLVKAAVLGLTDATYANPGLQFIPNMDGFPNGRRLEDDVTTIELQAVGGVVLAAIGLWYDDYTPGQSPVTPNLVNVLGFSAGVTKKRRTTQGIVSLCTSALARFSIIQKQPSFNPPHPSSDKTMKKLFSLLLTAVLLYLPYSQVCASSHREAPLISNDPLADNTDVYAFKSPTDAEKIVLIANYIPFEDPAGGPNWYTFGENIRYEIHVKNNAATPNDDVTYRFTFTVTNEDPTTFFNIRLGKQNQKATYTCERSVNGGQSWTTIITNGVVPPANIGPRSIENATVGLGAASYNALATKAITTASTGERIFCGPVDDPFFVDLGGIFDVGNFRSPAQGRDALYHFNCHTIAIEVPVSTLQKNGKSVSQAATILDPDYVIGVWASASRRKIKTIYNGGDVGYDGGWVQVSRLGMPLTNEAVIPIGMKDRWNATSPYANNDLQFTKYFTNPELALYMDDSKFGSAVPGLMDLRIQSKSLGSFDFRNGQPGLFGLKGNPALDGTALAENAFGAVLLPDNASPRAVDLLPIFYTGVPNLRPYQLATGKAGNPLAAGKPFIHNFLPTLGDMLRLNMAVPATPRNDPNFSSLGLVKAAVLGLTDATYANPGLQFIPNMDGFPNGRRLEDDVTTIELQAVGGVVLAAIGLWYDDYIPGSSPSPVTASLGKVLGFNAGVIKNDTTLKASFPFVQDPWRGFIGNSYMGPASTQTQPLSVTVLSYDCNSGNITFGRMGGDPGKTVEYQAAGVVNGSWSTNVNRQIEAELRRDANSRRTLTIQGRYVGDPASEISVNFDFRTPCGQARIGAEATTPLAVQVLGNPTTNSEVTVEVRGAAGQSLQLWVTNAQGQRVSAPSTGIAEAVERRTLRLGQQPGIYFLQVATPTETKTLKLVRH